MQRKVPLGFWAACTVIPILALAACEQAPESPLRPGDPSVQMSHGSSEMTPEFERQLAQLRRATARYHNFDAAVDEDYGAQFTPCWFHSGLGAPGYHFGNPLLIDEAAELLAPEILVYEPKRNGGVRLVGLEYIVPIGAWEGANPPSLLGEEFHTNNALGSLRAARLALAPQPGRHVRRLEPEGLLQVCGGFRGPGAVRPA